MKLENQVTSLKLSKKLKELGVKQESLCYWDNKDIKVNGHSPEYDEGGYAGEYETYPSTAKEIDWLCSAFTVAELGEMLPIGYINIRITDTFDKARYVCRRDRVDSPSNQYASTEAEARGKMLIHILEKEKL